MRKVEEIIDEGKIENRSVDRPKRQQERKQDY
jgi:hypothetical protein